MSQVIAQRLITQAYQASPMWTLTLPGDWASYQASTAWTPIAAAITTAIGIAGSPAGVRACYGQAVSLLRQTERLASTAPNLVAADRGALGQFCSEIARRLDPFTLTTA